MLAHNALIPLTPKPSSKAHAFDSVNGTVCELKNWVLSSLDFASMSMYVSVCSGSNAVLPQFCQSEPFPERSCTSSEIDIKMSLYFESKIKTHLIFASLHVLKKLEYVTVYCIYSRGSQTSHVDSDLGFLCLKSHI